MQKQEQPRPPFKLSGTATIKHLNVRKEGDDDNKILAVDIKMEVSKVDYRLCGFFDDALASFLWRGDTESMIARNTKLAPVAYDHEVKLANIDIDGMSFVGDAKKFQMQAKDGGVMTLTLSVTVTPSQHEVAKLAKLVQEGCRLSIEGQPDLFDNTVADFDLPKKGGK
jgi:hypothetical protein